MFGLPSYYLLCSEARNLGIRNQVPCLSCPECTVPRLDVYMCDYSEAYHMLCRRTYIWVI